RRTRTQPGKLFGNGDSGSTTWLTRAANASTRGSSRWADAYVSRPTAPSTNADAIENARLNWASYELRGRRLVSAGSQMIGTSPAGTRHSMRSIASMLKPDTRRSSSAQSRYAWLRWQHGYGL